MGSKTPRVLTIGPGCGTERIPIAKRFGGKVVCIAVDSNLKTLLDVEALVRFAERRFIGERRNVGKKVQAEVQELVRRQENRRVKLDFQNPDILRKQLLKITRGELSCLREIHWYGPAIWLGRPRWEDQIKRQGIRRFNDSDAAQKIVGVLIEFLEPSGWLYHITDKLEYSPLLGGLPKNEDYSARRQALSTRLRVVGAELHRYGESTNPVNWRIGANNQDAPKVKGIGIRNWMRQYTAHDSGFLVIARKTL